MKDLIVKKDLSVREAFQIISKTGEKWLVITQENGILKGTLSDGDLRRAILKGANLNDSVENVCNQNPVTLTRGNFTNAEAKKIFLEYKFALLPILDKNEPKELQVLDVMQLHAIIFREILKIDTREKQSQDFVGYKVNVDEAMASVDEGYYYIAFFMNPTSIQEGRRLAGMGIRLPQKATFFYPKLLSGLVINNFEQ